MLIRVEQPYFWLKTHFLTVVFVCFLTACAGRNSPAPVVNIDSVVTGGEVKSPINSDIYTVKKGETLYSIAWRADIDIRQLAELNNIKPPYVIFPGQKIFLDEKSAKLGATRATAKPPELDKKQTGQTTNAEAKKDIAVSKKQEYGEITGAKNTVIVPEVVTSEFSNKIRNWEWPAKGNIIRYFSTKPDGSKGIDIAGNRGDSVVAAADGKVVYAGNALSGYGNLLIIKHNDDYLSAYAHNDILLVKEQQEIKAGQLIAKMGSSDAETVNLHFEIRFRGKSVNPLKYLPRK